VGESTVGDVEGGQGLRDRGRSCHGGSYSHDWGQRQAVKN
jgi:hypothetical protein